MINIKYFLFIIYIKYSLICEQMRLTDFNKSCQMNSLGKEINLQNCENLEKMKKFTFIGWVKLRSTENFLISNTKDVIFTINSINETYPRLQFYFQNSFYLEFLEVNGNTQTNKVTEVISDRKTIYENIIQNWMIFVISVDYENDKVYFRSGYYDIRNKPILNLFIGKEIDINNKKDFDINTKILLSASQNYNNYGGCLDVNYIDFYYDWIPDDIANTGQLNQVNLILGNYRGLGLNYSRILIKDYIRVKKRDLNEAFNTCTYNQNTINRFISTDNSFIINGNEIYEGYFYECIFGGNLPSDDITISFKIFPIIQKNENIPILGFFLKSNEYSYNQNINNENAALNILSEIVTIKYDNNLNLVLTIIGEEILINPALTINKGTSIIINLIKINNLNGSGFNQYKRFIEIYFDGVKNFEKVVDFDFGETMKNLNTYDVYFYVGDHLTFFKNEYNFNFIYDNINIDQTPISSTTSTTNSTSTTTTTSSNTNINNENKILFRWHDILITENNLAKPGIPRKSIPSNCQLAIENFGCLWCNSGFEINYLNNCISTANLDVSIFKTDFPQTIIECGFGYFFNKELKICQECPIDCFSCEDLTKCLEKKKGCSINCKKCSQENLFTCIECDNGYFLDQYNFCVKCRRNNCKNCMQGINTCSQCFDGYYFNFNNNECEVCDGLCKTCINTSNNCLSCSDNFYLLNSKCYLIQSSFFTFKNTNSNRKCFNGCLNCLSSEYNECISCLPDYLLVISEKSILSNNFYGSCEVKCKKKFYYNNVILNLNGKFCLPCSISIGNCEECININTQVFCLRCKVGYYIIVDTSNNYKHLCAKCSENCKTCISNSNNCLTCNPGYKLKGYSNNQFKCIFEEKINKIENNTIRKYIPNCLETQYYNNYDCFNKCDTDYFRKKEYNNDCTLCSNNIEGCHLCNFYNGDCNLCLPNFKQTFKNNKLFCQNCYNNIVQCCEYGKGWENGNCLTCSDVNCENCQFRTKCEKCKTGYILSSLGICNIEISNCLVYNYDSTKCLKCSKNYSPNLNYNQCLLNCPLNNFKLIENGIIICKPCHINCATCTKPNDFRSCLTCNEGSILIGTYCKECKNKSLCSNFNSGTCVCSSCTNSSHSLINGICYSICPEGYYNNSGSCSSCFNCKNCTNNTVGGCGINPICLENHYISTNSGNKACCPFGKFYNGTDCNNNCDSDCKRCNGTGANNCLEAIEGKYINSTNYLNCNSNYKICTNGDDILDFKEICKYGYKSRFDSSNNKWISNCENNNLVDGCIFTLFDFTWNKNSCINCDNNLGLNFVEKNCISICESNYYKIKLDYKFQEILILNKQICQKIPNNCLESNEFINLGCTRCKSDYFWVETTAFSKSFESSDSFRKISFCNKCHSSCKTCLDSSFYSCWSCNDGKILFEGKCINKCEEGFVLENNNCIKNSCDKNLIHHPNLSTNTKIVCNKLCPKNNYYEKTTNKCINCPVNCFKCISNDYCLTCKNNYYLTINNKCEDCKYINRNLLITSDNNPNYFLIKESLSLKSICAPTFLQNYFRKNIQYDNIYIKNKNNDLIIGKSKIDKDGLYNLIDSNESIYFNFTASLNGRICYKTLFNFDINLENPNILHGEKLVIDINNLEKFEYIINKWDFLNESEEIKTQTKLLNQKFYLNNLGCNITDFKINYFLETDKTLVGFKISLENLNVHHFLCPELCKGCITWNQCSFCQKGSTFFSQQNKCISPYDSLTNDQNLLSLRKYEFKNNTIYGYFDKKINFTISNYYFPSLKIDDKIYENYTINYRYNNFIQIDIENNFKLNNGVYNLSILYIYPIVDYKKIGYENYGFNTTIKFEEEFNENLFDQYIKQFGSFSLIYQNILIFVILINNIYFNYYFIDFLHRLLPLFFIDLDSIEGLKLVFNEFKFAYLNPNLLDNNYFYGPFNHLLKTNKNYIKLNYNDLFSKTNLNNSIHSDYEKYIPKNKKLQESSFKINFIFNCDLIIFFIFIVMLIHSIFRFILYIVRKHYFKKLKLIENLTKVMKFFELKVYIKLFIISFYPVLFFILNDILNNSFNEELQIISFIITILFLIIYSFLFIIFIIITIKFPYLKDLNSINEHRKKIFFIMVKEIINNFIFIFEIENNEIEDLKEDKIIKNNIYDNDFDEEEEDEEEGGGFNFFNNKIIDKEEDEEENLNDKKKKKKKKSINQKSFIPIRKQKENDDEKKKTNKEEEEEEEEEIINDDKKSEVDEESLFEEEEEDEIVETEKLIEVDNFGEMLGKKYLKREKRIYYLKLMCIRSKPWFIKFIFVFEYMGKYYFSISNSLKLIYLFTILFITNSLIQIIIFSSLQTLFFLYNFFTRPFKIRYYNIFVVFNELLLCISFWIIFFKSLLQIKLTKNYEILFLTIIMYLNLIVYLLMLFVQIILLLIWFFKKIDFKKKKVEEEDF